MKHAQLLLPLGPLLLGLTLLPVAHADGNLEHGSAIYHQTCVACHGADGTGAIPGAPDFTKKDGRLTKSDDLLIQHIANGFQSPGSAMAMPPKGGNPSLTEDDIEAVLRYMRNEFGKQ